MTPDVVELAQVLFTVLMFVAGLTGIAFVSKYMKRRLELPLPLPPGPHDDRMDRLEQAVDAIAIEIERVSEAQRYTTKLLAERHDLPVER